MRLILRLLVLGGLALLVLPFLLSSLLLDSRGVPVTGLVVAKNEYVTVDYSSWQHHFVADLQYQPPDEAGVAFFKAQVPEDQYDALRRGDVLPLRYLLRRDVPDLPGLRTMRNMHLLFFARLANERTWTGLANMAGRAGVTAYVAIAVALGLLMWRILHLRGFAWAALAGLLCVMLVFYIGRFPRPTRAPQRNVRSATGTVKTLERWTILFRSKSDRSSHKWVADQPIAVAAVEFIPEGRTDAVVAVDLLDDGSLPGLAERAPVNIVYERAAPRVAQIQGARREFAERNAWGLVSQMFTLGVVVAVLWGGAKLFGAFARGLIRSGGSRS